ncbi:MAG: GNAT family N-acetyltransferase [Winogradskyella sp.]|nr:GNAT family N-acetyltransferase [Winogradskyella sp.]NNK40131.1 GNAT family N-acetyltransferase [Winogradskyella sp.]
MRIKIISYSSKYAKDFYDLNIEWLQTYFYVEDYDKEVLSNPSTYIIDKGGQIFFALIEDKVVGTVALMPTSEDAILELTKMAVLKDQRNKKIGQLLLQHCIEFARSQSLKALMLYSNTKLENAIYLYRKYGFKELQLEPGSPYERANIKMQLDL